MAAQSAQRRTDEKAPKSVREVTAALADAASKLSPEQRQSLLAHRRELPKLFAKWIEELKLPSATKPGADQGDGLGELLTKEEGRRRLRAMAQPLAIEDWAGPVAGPSELERTLGIPRSTLHAWQRHGSVVALLKGVRHHVFPVQQFIDSRPTVGVDAVLSAVGEPRTTWLWLVTEHPELGGKRPLDRLQAGAVDAVVDLAARDYGQS